MPTYQLNVDFSPTDLATLLLVGEKVVIAEQTSSSAHRKDVAWITFDPLQSNTITWTDDYITYVSNTDLQGRATIKILTQAMAAETLSLPFTNLGNFGDPDPNIKLSTDTFGIENKYTKTPFMVFGLAQEANVTGTAVPASPINANIVLKNHSAIFQPLETINVFLQTVASLLSNFVRTIDI